MAIDADMDVGDDAGRRVSMGAGQNNANNGSAASAGQRNSASAPTVPADPSAGWLERLFGIKMPADRLADSNMIPCVMLGERAQKASTVGKREVFEKKVNDERLSIEARTIDEKCSYLTAYVAAAEPVAVAAGKFGWTESTKVSKFGDLCQDALDRYWTNAVLELFPDGKVPDDPGTYDRVFRLWGDKWQGPGQRDAILVHVLTDMRVPENMTIESYTSEFIRLVEISRGFSGNHAWPGDEQLLGAYHRAVCAAWKAILGMTKSGTLVSFTIIKQFFKNLETNEETTGKRIADTLNPEAFKTSKKPRHADHRRRDDHPKGRHHKGQDRRHNGNHHGRGSHRGTHYAKKKNYNRGSGRGGGYKGSGGGSHRGGGNHYGGGNRGGSDHYGGGHRNDKSNHRDRGRYQGERKDRGGPPRSSKDHHAKQESKNYKWTRREHAHHFDDRAAGSPRRSRSPSTSRGRSPTRERSLSRGRSQSRSRSPSKHSSISHASTRSTSSGHAYATGENAAKREFMNLEDNSLFGMPSGTKTRSQSF